MATLKVSSTKSPTQDALVAAIKAEDSNPRDIATAMLRHIMASTPVKEGSSWRPEAGLKVRFSQKLQFPKGVAKFNAVKDGTAPMYRAYEYCAKLAAKLNPEHWDDSQLQGEAIFDALVEEGTLKRCGYNGGSIRFADYTPAAGTKRAKPEVDPVTLLG